MESSRTSLLDALVKVIEDVPAADSFVLKFPYVGFLGVPKSLPLPIAVRGTYMYNSRRQQDTSLRVKKQSNSTQTQSAKASSAKTQLTKLKTKQGKTSKPSLEVEVPKKALPNNFTTTKAAKNLKRKAQPSSEGGSNASNITTVAQTRTIQSFFLTDTYPADATERRVKRPRVK